MTGGVTHLGQGPPAGQGMTDERVPAVVDREHAKACQAERLAGGEEPAAEGVAILSIDC